MQWTQRLSRIQLADLRFAGAAFASPAPLGDRAAAPRALFAGRIAVNVLPEASDCTSVSRP